MQAARIDLLALPCAGASATMYLRWRRRLPEWVRLVPVELPGRGSRMGQPFADDFDSLVAQLCDEHAESLRGSYALFGHSMGALLAYGMAQRQHALGEPLPRALFVSASPAPSQCDPGRFARRRGDAALMEELRERGGTPEEVFANQDLLRMALATLGADYRLCASFRHAGLPPLPIPLQVLAGRADQIEAGRIEAWQREAGGAYALDWFEGGHFYLREREPDLLAVIVHGLRHRLPGTARPATDEVCLRSCNE